MDDLSRAARVVLGRPEIFDAESVDELRVMLADEFGQHGLECDFSGNGIRVLFGAVLGEISQLSDDAKREPLGRVISLMTMLEEDTQRNMRAIIRAREALQRRLSQAKHRIQ
jgi:hypothetical protein